MRVAIPSLRPYRAQGAFTLAEVLVVLVVVALVLGPILAASGVLARLQHRTGERSRREAWRSVQDEALVSGIDPSRAPILQVDANPAVPPSPAAPVERLSSAAPDSPVVLGVLKSSPGPEAGRVGGAGWELLAGAAQVGATPLALPARPILLNPPVIQPASGSHVPASMLVPAAGAATLAVSASSPDGMRVHIAGPGSTAVGEGAASVNATAAELARGFHGTAWTEYPGGAGETAEPLPDGRIRWLVTVDGGRIQAYEPSERVAFEVGIDLGSPVLVWGADELPSGSVVPVDLAAYLAVRAGTVHVRVAWPASLASLFGPDAANVLPALACSFAGLSVSEDLSPLFQPEAAAAWSAENRVSAEAIASGGCVASPAAWIFQRAPAKLGPPELLSGPALVSDAYPGGSFEFGVPERPGLGRVGRISSQGGAVMSAGPTLSLALSP